MAGRTYIETFDKGAGGWYGPRGNLNGLVAPAIKDGAMFCHSPWWVDYNHAPPGAGYINMLACLNTSGGQPEAIKEVAGENRFIGGGYPIDFTNSRITLRIKGEMLSRGAELVLLIQGYVEGICSGWMLTGRPFRITSDWSEQIITLEPKESQWTPLGSRHDRTDMYGVKPLEQVLSNVSANIMLVMFPLAVEAIGPVDGDPHILRAGRDYPVWQSKLPEGYVLIDTVKIEFAQS